MGQFIVLHQPGEWIWGRGTIDNKNGVIGILYGVAFCPL